ncbi:Putative disease resistance TIR-NBS-LRR class protein, partial [Prunus dulcis]
MWRNVSLECYTHYLKYLPGFGIHYEYHKVKVEVPRGVGLAWRRLSGVETDPIRGVGCTGVWGDIRIVWYGRTWRRLSSVLTGPIRGVGSTGVGILGNVPFIGETLPKFQQEVSVFGKWARLRGYPALTGPIRGVRVPRRMGGFCELQREKNKNYVWLDPSKRVRRQPKVGILGNVPFIGETLPKFQQEVSVFGKWARLRGDVWNSKDSSRILEKLGRVLQTHSSKPEAFAWLGPTKLVA